MKQIFVYGKYRYEYYIEFSDRQTLGLLVHPNLNIVAKAPHETSLEDIEAFMQRKWVWLERQLNELSKYQKKYHKREYISGEAIHYLGRQYMLLVKLSDKNEVKLERGRLTVYTTKDSRNSTHNQILVVNWFEQRRKLVFAREYRKALKQFRFDNQPPELKIREMSKRWGSCTPNGNIYLHPKLIQTPTEAIHYVLIHELCHVWNKKHDKEFYKQLERRVPKWREIKEKLEVRYG